MRLPTFKKGGSKRKEKKRRCQKGISPSDKKIIPHKKKARKFVVEEDHREAVADIMTGKSRSQNRWKKMKQSTVLLRKDTGKENSRQRRTRRDENANLLKRRERKQQGTKNRILPRMRCQGC
jgi:hypothetical protein